jgi:hypothetical protein
VNKIASYVLSRINTVIELDSQTYCKGRNTVSETTDTGVASRVAKWMSIGSGRRPRTRAAPRLVWLDEQRESHTVAKVPPPKNTS